MFGSNSLLEERHQTFNEEICDNALDDDGDGLIDFNDPDCACEVVEPESLIPNPSFEHLDCCPPDEGELDCAYGWIQASFPTTDFIHICGWMGWDHSEQDGGRFPPPQPFPDGMGIVGFRDGVTVSRGWSSPEPQSLPEWKEYAGACLTRTLKAHHKYKIAFHVGFVDPKSSPPINITLFGHPECESLPFGGAEIEDIIGCPTNEKGWMELGSNYVHGGEGNKWVQSYIEFIPDKDINAVSIGPSCVPNKSQKNYYYFLDNLVLDEKAAFDLNPKLVGNPCGENLKLEIDPLIGFEYQWYKDGIALIGETSTKLSKMYGEGIYQIRIHNGRDCKSSGEFHYTTPIIRNTVDVLICEGKSYSFAGTQISEPGMYIDTLVSTLGCDSIVTLNLEYYGAEKDTIIAYLVEGDSYEFNGKSYTEEGVYDVDVLNRKGCLIPTNLQLKFVGVHFPNIFSPNHDGINDKFTFKADDELIYDIELSIFDRWGNRLSKEDVWDGKFNGKVVSPGVYVYAAKIKLINFYEHTVYGTVTVVH